MIVGDFIARMDSDDIAIKDRLEKQLKYLKDNNLDLIGSGLFYLEVLFFLLVQKVMKKI